MENDAKTLVFLGYTLFALCLVVWAGFSAAAQYLEERRAAKEAK